MATARRDAMRPSGSWTSSSNTTRDFFGSKELAWPCAESWGVPFPRKSSSRVDSITQVCRFLDSPPPGDLRIFVCDDKCGPSFGDDWGSARDFWLAAGESQSFDCSGQCFVGIYYDDHSPTLGDMALADDDELFQGDETGYIRNGIATHKAN